MIGIGICFFILSLVTISIINALNSHYKKK